MNILQALLLFQYSSPILQGFSGLDDAPVVGILPVLKSVPRGEGKAASAFSSSLHTATPLLDCFFIE